MDSARSLFAYTFRLTPWEAAIGMHFHRQQLAPDFNAVCVRDQLILFWLGDTKDHDAARTTAVMLARHLVNANAYLAHPALSVTDAEPVSWLEVTDVKSTSITSGYMSPTQVRAPLKPGDPEGARLQEAAELVRRVGLAPHFAFALFMALSDFHAASREAGPYAAFYAVRVLEDVGFAFGAVEGERPDWTSMNAALGTIRLEWKPLTDAGTRARHMNEEKLAAPSLSKADALQLAHRALTLLLQYAKVR